MNWALRRYGDRRILETHVVYDVARLRRQHERVTNLAARAWLVATHQRLAPELSWVAPAVYYLSRA